MSAPLAGKFQDHYQVLGVEPEADGEAIKKAYDELSTLYHPRNPKSADKAKFDAVTLAYEVLSDPATRTVFDSVRSGPEKEPAPEFSGANFFDQLVGERERRLFVLCLLYDRRRIKPRTPGLSVRQLECLTTMSFGELDFAIWYLKQTGMVASDDKSNLQITVRGMDHLEERMPDPEQMLKLMKGVGVSDTAPEVAVAAPAPPPEPAPKPAAPEPAPRPEPKPEPKPAAKPAAQEATSRRPIVIPPKRPH